MKFDPPATRSAARELSRAEPALVEERLDAIEHDERAQRQAVSCGGFLDDSRPRACARPDRPSRADRATTASSVIGTGRRAAAGVRGSQSMQLRKETRSGGAHL